MKTITQSTFQPLTADEVQFSYKLDYCETPIDEAFSDPEDLKEILWRLETFDTWAWATVQVFAKWNGFSDYAALGEISVADAAEFEREFLPDLQTEALDFLNEQLTETWQKLSSRVK